MTSIARQLDSKIPQPVRGILDVLSDQSRRAIMVILIEKNELSFKELMGTLGFGPSSLAHHLKELMKAGLLENIYRKSEDKDDYSIYRPTELGHDFMMMLMLGRGLDLPAATRKKAND